MNGYGREIVQYLQKGARRAVHGDQVLERLSARLQERVGRGYSVTNLKYFRVFYQIYADREPAIRHEARDELPGGAAKSHGRPGCVALIRRSAPRSTSIARLARTPEPCSRCVTAIAKQGTRDAYQPLARSSYWQGV